MAAGSIVVDLLMRTGTFETDTARAGKALKKLERDAEQSARRIKESFIGNLAAGFAKDFITEIATIPGRFVDMVKGAIDAADHLNDLSKKTGVAVEVLGGLGFAASQAGGGLESTALGLGKLNKEIAQAAAGNKKSGEAFKALGIDVRDTNGKIKDAGKLFIEIADKFEQFEDGPNKAALALRLFGKAGLDQIPVLNEGGKALQANIDYYNRFGGVTTETAKKADEFNDTLGKSRLITEAFGRTLAAEALTPLQAIATAFLEAKEKGDGFKSTAEGIVGVLKVLAAGAADVVYVIATVGDTIAAVIANAEAMQRAAEKKRSNQGFFSSILDPFGTGSAPGSDAGVKAIDELLEERSKERRRLLEKFKAELNAPLIPAEYSNEGRTRRRTKKADTPGLPGDPDKKEKTPRLSEAERFLEALQKELAKKEELTKVGLVLREIESGRLTGLNAKIAGKALDVAAEMDERKRLKDAIEQTQSAALANIKTQIEAANAAEKEVEQLAEANIRYREETEVLGANKEMLYLIEQARLSSAIALKEEALALALSTDETNNLSIRLQKQIDLLRQRFGLMADRKAADEFNEQMKEAQREAEHLNDTLRGAFEDAFVDFISGSKSAGDAFKSFANSVIQEMIRIEAKKLALSFFGDGKKDGGGWLSILKALSGFFGQTNYSGVSSGGGGFAAPGGTAPLATGTNRITRAGNYFLHKDEAVVPKAYNPAVGGGGGVVIHNYAGADVSTTRDNDGQLEVIIAKAAERGAQMGYGRAVSEVLNGGGMGKAIASTYGLSRAAGAPKRA